MVDAPDYIGLLEANEALYAEIDELGSVVQTYRLALEQANERIRELENEAAERLAGARVKAAEEQLHLTEYEIQVLLGTSISGCNMSSDRVFSLDMAWHRLRALELIDRADGLAIITKKGQDVVARILSALADHPRDTNPVVSHETANVEDKEPAGEVEPVACVACEDNPKGGNNPCAVCGRTTPPASAIREVAETARACLAGLVSAGHNCPSPDPDQIEKAFWALDSALAGSAE